MANDEQTAAIPSSAAPVLSVVIPTYDRAHVLADALHALLPQCDHRVEVIVVDDGSTDNTVAMLAREFGDRVRMIEQGHGGVSRARNRGAAEARGEYLAFLDSDDLPTDNWVAALLAACARGDDIFSGTAEYRYEDGTRHVVAVEALGPAFGHLRGVFLAGTFTVRKRWFDEAGGYLDGLAYGENTNLAMHLGEVANRRGLRISTSDEAVVIVHARTRVYSARRSYDSATRILSRSRWLLERDPRVLAIHLAGAGVAASRLGYRRQAVTLLWRAFRTHPREWRNIMRLFRATVARPGSPRLEDGTSA